MKTLSEMFNLKLILLIGTLSVLATGATSCGKQEQSRAERDNSPASNVPKTPVDPAAAGSVTGLVKFDGVPPEMKVINMAAVPNCAKENSSPAMTEDVVRGDNGTLQNVLIYLKGDFSHYSFATPDPVTIRQKGCVYSPHVVAIMTGAPLEVINSDQTTHNVNAASKERQGWNETQAPGATPVTRTFTHGELGMRVKCNLHPWMKMYVSVFEHPYFQATSKDGSFSLKNIPSGNYTLVAWHELYGTKEQPVVVKAGEAQSVSFTFTDRDRR
jgi:plastocyanin